MKGLFFRSYLLVALTILGLGWSIGKLYDTHVQTVSLTTDVDLHKGTLFLINRELTRFAGEEQSYLSAIGTSFGFPVSLLALDNIDRAKQFGDTRVTAKQLAYLRQGGVVSLFDDFDGTSWFLQKRSVDNSVIVLGPINNAVSTQSEALFSTLFLAGLALAVFIWLWPISKGLIALTKATRAFGKGDFSARVDSDIPASLQHLARQFNAMAARIQRLIKSHKELSHAVSHELRTPIARIRFAMEMAREVKSVKAREHYLDAMDDNIEELDSLVDELLTYARFDREEPQLHFTQVDMNRLIETSLDKFRMTHSALNFKLYSMANEVFCWCDEDAIIRVLDNLIRNAVRYANKHIEVQLELNSQALCLSVNDDGPGIPESCRTNLFDPFVRLDQSRDRQSGGIGLGLAIVKRYIELHQGTVAIAESKLGGACFCLSLPVNKIAESL